MTVRKAVIPAAGLEHAFTSNESFGKKKCCQL